MNADLVDFLARFEDISGTELYAEVATLATLINYENVRVPELQTLRRLDGHPARFGRAPWLNLR
jgi:hypothetical protein